MFQHDQLHSMVEDIVPIGSGYNHFSQEMSKKNLDPENFQFETIYTKDNVKIEILQIENRKEASRNTDASLNGKLFPLSASLKSSRDSKSSSTSEIYRCRVVTRKDSMHLKSDIPWDNTNISDYGTAYFSDVLYGGIMDVEVTTQMDDDVKELDINGGASIEAVRKLADVKVGHNNRNNANGNRFSISVRYHGGSIENIPSSKEAITGAMAEFVKSVSQDSTVVVERYIKHFPVGKDTLGSIGCHNYINAKKEKCLSLDLSPGEREKLLQDFDRIVNHMRQHNIVDLTRAVELFAEIIQRHPKVSKQVDAKPEVGIICLGNARVGKSRLLTTSQTNFDPKFAPTGSDTDKASQQFYTSSYGNVGLIDTPGLYEVNQEHIKRNIKEITSGLGMAQYLKLCLVTKANSGNIHDRDHAMIARVSECLSSMSYNGDEYSIQPIESRLPSLRGDPIVATLIINSIDEWSLDSYSQENINIIFDSIMRSVIAFKGRLLIQQIILIASMNPKLLEKKTDKLMEFINETADTNELKGGKLKATLEDLPMIQKLISAAGAGSIGFSSGLVAGGAVDAMIISATGIAPVLAFGVVAAAGSVIIYRALIGAFKSKRAIDYRKSRERRIPVYVLKSTSTVPESCCYITYSS